MIIGTAGHIDHGKTALIKALTGMDADRLKEEKERGITIDLGYAFYPLPRGEVLGFIDVPGHERFVHNMLAGATGIDIVLLVVAADDGVMPQTREHLEIIDLLGVKGGVVALTKIDRVEPARVAAARAEIEALLRGTALAGSPVFALSSMTGDGVPALRAHLEDVAASPPPAGAADGCFRLAVDRCFTLSGSGTVVTGTVFSGSVGVGDHLLVSPPGLEVRVRSIHAQNRAAERGAAGQRCALSLVGVEKKDIARGDWVLEPAVHAPTARFDALLTLPPSAARALRHWTPVHVHLGATEAMGRVSLLQATGIDPGGSGRAQIVLDRPVGALRGDRFILRDQSAQQTLAGGVVLDPFAPARKVRTPARLAVLAALERPAVSDVLRQLLDDAPAGVDLSWFARSFNLRAKAAETLYREISMAVVNVAGAGRFGFSPRRWEATQQAVLAALAAEHARVPEVLGLEGRRLRRLATPDLPWELFTALIDRMLAGRRVARHGPWLHLPQHRITLTGAEEKLWRAVEPLLRAAPFQPPWVRDIARTLAAPEPQVRSLLQRVTMLGDAYEVMRDRFFTREAIADLARIVSELAAEKGEVTAAEFRDRIGTGRKIAIRILEYFDKTGFSRRVGDAHRVRDPALLVERITSSAGTDSGRHETQVSGRDSHPGGANGLQIR
ncbi:MAG: selenocysteine-specific translation elongation factor [Nitrospirae bacterium]|nr:MAG: selenocysteine-specific translation elongation factor [Nitrospirota bacterium]